MKKAEKSRGKRSRSTNFTPHETNLLLCLIEQNSTTLENKTTNAVTWQQKKHCWEQIANEFCSQSLSNRTATSLREKYENMKRQTKATLQANRKEYYITGRVNAPTEVASIDERVAALMGTSAYDFDDNDFDSDPTHGPVIKDEEQPEQRPRFEYGFFVDDKNVETVLTEPHEETESAEREPYNKTEIPSLWKPSILRRKKPAKLKLRKRSTQNRNDELLEKQKIFYENEERRAEERHQLQMRKLYLKIDLLNIEKTIKTLQMKEMENLNNRSSSI